METFASQPDSQLYVASHQFDDMTPNNNLYVHTLAGEETYSSAERGPTRLTKFHSPIMYAQSDDEHAINLDVYNAPSTQLMSNNTRQRSQVQTPDDLMRANSSLNPTAQATFEDGIEQSSVTTTEMNKLMQQ